MPPELILASTSPYRRELLARLGLPFRCIAPPVDEDTLKQNDLSPQVLAEMLAEAKAASVAISHTSAVVIGCDQLAHCEGRILGKPGSRTDAISQLQSLAGRRHELITAMVLHCGEQIWRHTDRTSLQMRSLSTPEIAAYVDLDIPFDCAGSYKLERHGIALFESIDSQDFSAITGLPLIQLGTWLRTWGFSLTQ